MSGPELRIEEGPVVIVQTNDDPGDMGEPRVITEDGATVVFVPSFKYWPDDTASPGPTPGLPWLIRFTCCGRADGVSARATWEEADALRQSYMDPGNTSHVRSAIIEDALAASPAPEPTGLDAAWAEAEAALPTDRPWMLEVVYRGAIAPEPNPWTGMPVKYPDRYEAEAQPMFEAAEDELAFSAFGPTPAAALRALAARLTGEADRG